MFVNMCGIVGFLGGHLDEQRFKLKEGLALLTQRGPDNQTLLDLDKAMLGHARLSILDTSESANQPFSDPTKRYFIVFNGEIYNFEDLRKKYLSDYSFKTTGDTEVLLHLLIKMGADVLNELNGFFSFCFYDKLEDRALIARDRYGQKPLVYTQVNNRLIFGSEIKSIIPLVEKKRIDEKALNQFFKFNYVPAPLTMFEGVFKLEPGCFIDWNKGEISNNVYYKVKSEVVPASYSEAKSEVRRLLVKSVKQRMISDVPLGAFLSGGVDSSIVSAIAAKETKHLKTFSLGFKNNKLFDESAYAEEVARHIKSDHQTFMLGNDDFLEHFDECLNYLDEPFADSSALNVLMLSKRTKEHVTVALSGDGADELFSGYNKHSALFLADNLGLKEKAISKMSVIANILPKSRNSKLGNLSRKLSKFSKGIKLSSAERYVEWASFMDENTLNKLLLEDFQGDKLPSYLKGTIKSFNDYLFNDFRLVLEGDMLRKVDAMSMANSLEVRSPFLDHELVDYVFSLPESFKINRSDRKKILKEAFKDDLPVSVFNRAKHGFEIPLLNWFQNDLSQVLKNEVFNRDFVEDQNIFDWTTIKNFQDKISGSNSEDVVYNVWALLAFQRWYKAYF